MMIQTKLSVQEEIDLYKKFNQTNSVRIIRQITRYLTHEISDRLEKSGHFGLSARHLSVFENVDFEGTNIVTLANRAGVTKQAMSKLVKEVNTEGYVHVKTDQRDSRVVIVSFSEKGIDFLRDMRREIQITRAHLNNSDIMSQEESTSMINGLQKLLSYLENSAN